MQPTGQGLSHRVPDTRAESNKGDEAKGEAKACEGKGSDTIKKASCSQIIVIMNPHGNYDSNPHT